MKEYPIEQDKEPFEGEEHNKIEFDDVVGQLYSNCPVQGYGKIGDNPFYFRARHDSWQFHVGSVGDAEYGEGSNWHEIYYYEQEYGEGHAASWMSKRIAKEIVLDCIEEFRKGRVK